MSRRKTLAALVLLAALATCSVACAVNPAITSQVNAPNYLRARELNEAGVDAYATGHPRDALGYFRESRRLWGEPSVLWNEARCFEQIDDVDQAERSIVDYLKQSGLKPEDRAQGERELASLKARPSRVTVVTSPPGATITIDGQPQWGIVTPVSLGVGSGNHAIAVKRDGYQPVSRPVQLALGHALLLEIDLVKATR